MKNATDANRSLDRSWASYSQWDMEEDPQNSLRDAADAVRRLASRPPAERAVAEAMLRQARQRAAEASHRFNRPDMFADASVCDHWSKMPYWSDEEAAALLLERNPKLLNRKAIRAEPRPSEIGNAFQRLRDLAFRALAAGEFTSGRSPSAILLWAKQKQIAIPASLQASVDLHTQPVVDWKKAHDQKAIELERVQAELDTSKAQLKAVITEQASANRSLLTRERTSVLKLILGMAIGGYGYAPTASRSPVAKDIAGDLHRLGLTLDEDTVRKYLEEAKGLLPSDWNQSDA
ncbi:MAG: hypothetical protein Q8O26_19220 [Phreatobacter sp.]|uniref:hypothetical protein n=1 Tax=Phreatobacter sp. TaxID=1966341 RepID=UPI00273768C2|nr:hypothetical protein [Phreatobacter sp.]MDP2804007.1 hypothetical protein [Phreatobacter sp.]